MKSAVPAESDDLERVGRAQVRDSEDSLEVVLTYRGEDDLVHVMPGARSHAGAVIPSEIHGTDEQVARAAASCTLRLPRSLSHPGVIDRVIEELEGAPGVAGWQQSHWLRGQLVVCLSHDFTAEVAGHAVCYDGRLGLLVDLDGSGEGDR